MNHHGSTATEMTAGTSPAQKLERAYIATWNATDTQVRQWLPKRHIKAVGQQSGVLPEDLIDDEVAVEEEGRDGDEVFGLVSAQRVRGQHDHVTDFDRLFTELAEQHRRSVANKDQLHEVVGHWIEGVVDGVCPRHDRAELWQLGQSGRSGTSGRPTCGRGGRGVYGFGPH